MGHGIAGEKGACVMDDGASDLERAKLLLAEGGITSIDDLVNKAAEAARERDCSVAEVLAGRSHEDHRAPEIAWRAEPHRGPFRHRPLEISVLLDDREEVDGRDIRKWDGTALDFVVDGGGEQPERVRAFTVGAAAAEYMKSVEFAPDPPKDFPMPGSDGTPSFHVTGVPTRFFEHSVFSGNWRSLDLAHILTNLTAETMTGWWFWAVSWNDQISSVIGGSNWTTMWEHVFPPRYGYPPGSRLHLGQFQMIGNLVPLGWNDRVSAISHHYFPE